VGVNLSVMGASGRFVGVGATALVGWLFVGVNVGVTLLEWA